MCITYLSRDSCRNLICKNLGIRVQTKLSVNEKVFRRKLLLKSLTSGAGCWKSTAHLMSCTLTFEKPSIRFHTVDSSTSWVVMASVASFSPGFGHSWPLGDSGWSWTGFSSDWIDVTSGVPQGTVLGPLLFLVYVNDLPDAVQCPLRMFADDTKLFARVTTDREVSELQTDIDALAAWSRTWLMPFKPAPHWGAISSPLSFSCVIF